MDRRMIRETVRLTARTGMQAAATRAERTNLDSTCGTADPIWSDEMANNPNFSRRLVMKRMALLAGSASLPGLIASAPAHAQTKVSQATAKYQNTPSGDKKCSTCLQFVPGKSAQENGTCKVVEGSISPNGYCTLWVAKQ